MRQLSATIAVLLVGLWPSLSLGSASSSEFLERMQELAVWITKNSSFDALPEQPSYVYLTESEIHDLVAAGNAARAARLKKNFAIRAMYSEGVMYLRDDIAADDESQVLLHELVHHFQWTSDRKYQCRAEREAEAYDLQRRYAEDINEPPRIPGTMILIALTRCRGD